MGDLDVIVVGGGAAGLLAAHLLHKSGLRVKLLEAQGMLGGRMYHREGLFQWPIDLGGEFVHGQTCLFKKLCDEHGVSTIRTFSSFPPEPYFTDGRPVSEFIYMGQEGTLTDWVELQRSDPDFKHLLSVIRSMGDDTTLRVGEDLYHYFVRKGVNQRVLSLADAVYAKTWATDLQRLDSSRCVHENEKPYAGEENFILEHSTRQLVNALAKGLDVGLNEEVVGIESSGSNATTSSKVKTKSGKVYRAKKVIVCAPITVVRDGGIQFSPPLPETYRWALKNAGIGVSIKGVIKFTRRFWPKADMLLVFCSESPVPQLWMDPPRPGYPNEKSHAITCFVTGTPAEAAAKMPTWKVLALWLSQLDSMFGTKDDRRPASSSYEDHSICKWENLAYTFPGAVDAEILCGPVANNAVYFAGEHCGVAASEIATINGALESGKHAATQVLSELGKQSKL